MTNTLYYGDNLDILRDKIPSASVDLVYLDPPFNSSRSYNVLFRNESGAESDAQIQAFEDTWHWNQKAEETYRYLATETSDDISKMVAAMRSFIGENQMMAYLVMMTARLIELHRVLKPTGSLYLHCDPAASHYLKVILDTIFDPRNFRSEIVWRRSAAHNKLTRQYGPIHDTILFYSKSNTFTFHPGRRPYAKDYIAALFTSEDKRGRYRLNMLTGPETRDGESGLPWHGFNPTAVGRHWAIPSSVRELLPNGGEGMSTQQQLDALLEQGAIVFPQKEGGQPQYKQYIGSGTPYQDIWAYQPGTRGVLYGTDDGIDEDVKYLDQGDEKLGYETQKPLGLLERIILTSSNPGDVVLDPFCGCGTTVAAAQKLGRQWIGIDITTLSITVMTNRLTAMFPDMKYSVEGVPQDMDGVVDLVSRSRYQFQWWVCWLLRAQPFGGHAGSSTGKKGSDRGIDGIKAFFDDASGQPKRVIVQVKSGHVKSGDVRDLAGVLNREKAAIGVFVTLEPPSRDMLTEAATAGFYRSPGFNRDFARLQILTIADLLKGHARVDMPPEHQLLKQALRVKAAPVHAQGSLFGGVDDEDDDELDIDLADA